MNHFLTYREGLDLEFDIVVVDTEFSRLPLPAESLADWAAHVSLLSVGLAALHNTHRPNQFYAVRTLSDAIMRSCSEFVQHNVLPLLGHAEPDLLFAQLPTLRGALLTFLGERRRLTGKPALLAVDYAGDALLISRVLGTEPDVVVVEAGAEVEWGRELYFSKHGGQHNAQHDALALRDGLWRRLRQDEVARLNRGP